DGRSCFCPPRTASCFSEQLRIQVEGDPRGVGICHCLACQKELVVSSQRWRASLPRLKSPVPPPNTCASEIKEPSSYSGSVRFVGLPSSIPKTATMSQWLSPWVRLLTLTFQRLTFPSTTAAGTLGSVAAKHDGVRQR